MQLSLVHQEEAGKRMGAKGVFHTPMLLNQVFPQQQS